MTSQKDFDEAAATDYAEKWYHETDFIGSQQEVFVAGARWMHDQLRAEIEALKACEFSWEQTRRRKERKNAECEMWESEYKKAAHALETKRAKSAKQDSALDKIDWHIRSMQNDKIISMKEMIRALKVISDALKESGDEDE